MFWLTGLMGQYSLFKSRSYTTCDGGIYHFNLTNHWAEMSESLHLLVYFTGITFNNSNSV
jgi:hypothetical protein